MPHPEVLMAGAGTVGTPMACELTHCGVACRLIDKGPPAGLRLPGPRHTDSDARILPNLGIAGAASAGVKTNLVFFTKGRPTETIWYYDLSDLKIGKKTPLTQAHFEDFFKQLPARGDSERSWTVPFAARLQQALEEARPFRERAAELSRQAEDQEDAFKERRKAKGVSQDELARLEEEWRRTLREARETLAKAESIENAVYDLKAVNPNRPNNEDRRTPEELLAIIEEKGREADAALDRLRQLLAVRP